MEKIRPMAHAWTFYPAQPQVLAEMLFAFYTEIDKYIDFEKYKLLTDIRAIFVPHAWYIYSGIIAVSGYKVFQLNNNIKRLILIWPAHYEAVNGWMLSSFDKYLSPLWSIDIDRELQSYILSQDKNAFVVYDQAHLPEHSLEVQLPFIQTFLNIKSIVPILFGIEPDIRLLSKVLFDILSKHNDVGVLVSTDLSHYLRYDEAINVDTQTLEKFMKGDDTIGPYEACGYAWLNVLINLYKLLNYNPDVIMYANSGDTSGVKDQVVGYATGMIWK